MRERAGSIGGRVQILPHVPSGTAGRTALFTLKTPKKFVLKSCFDSSMLVSSSAPTKV
jgi:hypothetical protein